MTDIKPLLKWAGGKRWLAPRIVKLYESSHHNGVWCEPFVGAGAVALALRPDYAILNDINAHLINFHRQVQLGLRFQVLAMNFINTADSYLARRKQFNDLIGTQEQETPKAAALFWYLNRTCFNGLCRFNRRGAFNVGYGKYAKIDYGRLSDDFSAHQELTARWRFTAGDFSQLTVEPGTFIYFDPPYDDRFTSYSAAGFGWPDHVRLAMWLDQHDGPAVISNLATERMIALYQDSGFSIETLNAPRSIACNGDRKPVKELLATKGIAL